MRNELVVRYVQVDTWVGELFQEFEGEFRGFLFCGQVEPGGVDVGILWKMSILLDGCY